MSSQSFRNGEKRAAAKWSAPALIALGVMVVTPFSGTDMMMGGFALMTIALAVLIWCAVAAVIFGLRGRRLQRLVEGESLLVHWTYTPDEWRRYVAADFAEDRKEKAALFRLVAVIALVVWLLLVVVLRGYDAPLFGVIILGILAFLGLVALVVPRLMHRLRARSRAEAFVSLTGAYVAGTFHDWAMLGAGLDGAAVTEKPIPMLAIRYWCPTATGRLRYTVRVPIPAGKIDEAESAIARLMQGR